MLTASFAQKSEFIWGTVYNVFHEEYATDEDFFAQVDKDIEGIRKANFTHILIFPMNQWDAELKRLKWDRTDYLVSKIEKAGLKFVPLLLKEEQCSHYFPIWKFKEIEGLWDKHNRSSNGKNSRENVDFADPQIYPLVEEYFEEIIKRYGKSPALSFYNIWNEPHYSSEAKHVIDSYIEWLKKKYNTLENLRKSWGEDYTSWEEVSPFLNDNWNSCMPQIDYTLFRNEFSNELLGRLKNTLRKFDQTHPINTNPVSTPFVDFSGFSGYSTDNWAFTKYSDFTGVSFYPDAWERSKNLSEKYPDWQYNFFFNTIRSSSLEKNYILTELFTNTQNGFALNGYLDKDFNNKIAWTAFANNCKGIIYWKWEPFLRGRQSLGRGLVGTNGELAERGKAVSEIGQVVKKHKNLILNHKLSKPQTAILLDMVGILKLQEQPTEPRTNKLIYESNAGIFKALHEANIEVDLLRTDLDLELSTLKNYKIIYLPFQIVLREEIASLLKKYVEQGGWLVADARFASINELDFGFRESPGHGMSELFGVSRKDWLGTLDKMNVKVSDSDLFSSQTLSTVYFKEYLSVNPSAKILAYFNDKSPAIVSNNSGKGKTIYCAFPLGGSYFHKSDLKIGNLISEIACKAGVVKNVKFISQDDSELVIKLHENQDSRLIYILNYDSVEKKGVLELKLDGLTINHIKDLNNEQSLTFNTHNSLITIPITIKENGVNVLHLTK